MGTRRTTVAAALALAACSAPASTGESQAPLCVPGASVACACTSGASGAQACRGDGTYGECVCGGEADAGSDAPTDGQTSDGPVNGDGCVPDDVADCVAKCGTIVGRCDQPVNCGGCPQYQYCADGSDHSYAPEANRCYGCKATGAQCGDVAHPWQYVACEPVIPAGCVCGLQSCCCELPPP